jgi:predicted Ser/Thr protein kinase
MAFTLSDLELELIDLLKTQGLPAGEIRLIGLLGQGTRASAFSVIIDNVHHVLKVYDSKESLRAELKNLRKIIPKERLLFWWQEHVDGSKLNLVIIEVPEGRALNGDLLTPAVSTQIAERLRELNRISYRQRVSVTALKERLERITPTCRDHLELLKHNIGQFNRLLDHLDQSLEKHPDVFRVPKVRIHGDLWWPNVVISSDAAYLIDWESVRRGAAAEDIAKLRFSFFFPQDAATSVYFWRHPEDSQKVHLLMNDIIERYEGPGGPEGLVTRLKLYFPLHAAEILANSYLLDQTEGPLSQAINRMVIDQGLALAANPLAPAPDLSSYGYWDELERLRFGSPD